MRTTSFLGLVSAIILFSAFTISSSTSWEIAEGYSIAFESKDPSGVFTKMDGDINFDEANLDASSFDVAVEVASINTGNGMKNKHAKSAKWFDAEKYPEIRFTSSAFAKTADGYTVTGTLDMHGVQKEFTMPFTFENNTFKSSFMVSRVEFGIGSTKGMSGKVPAEIKLDLSVPVKQ